MSRKTENLELNLWDEDDYVDFEEINENFEKLDTLSLVDESGTAVASYTKGSIGSTTWYYKKYLDGTVEMSTLLPYAALTCNLGAVAPYKSENSIVNFPFQFSSLFDCQMHMASETNGWIVDVTGASDFDHVEFYVSSVDLETEVVYKQVYVNVKGVLATV